MRWHHASSYTITLNLHCSTPFITTVFSTMRPSVCLPTSGPFSSLARVHNQALAFSTVFPQTLLSVLSLKLLHSSCLESPGPLSSPHVHILLSMFWYSTLSLLSCPCLLFGSAHSPSRHSWNVSTWAQAKASHWCFSTASPMPGTQLAFLIIISMNGWVTIDIAVVYLLQDTSCSPIFHKSHLNSRGVCAFVHKHGHTLAQLVLSAQATCGTSWRPHAC